jgi:hypothetical protein
MKSPNLSILSIFDQIDSQIYKSIHISPQTSNLCCLDPNFNLFFIQFIFYYLTILLFKKHKKNKIRLSQLPPLYNIYEAKPLETLVFFWLCVVNL